MGYDETEVFFGKHHDGQDVIAGFRFVVPLNQGTVLTSGSLMVWLEKKYPEGLAVWDRFTDANGTLLTAHTMDMGSASGWFQYLGSLTIQDNQAYGAGTYACESDVSDGTVKLQIVNQDTEGTGRNGIAFRLLNGNNYWRFYTIRLFSGRTIRLDKIVDGVVTLIDIATPEGYTGHLKVILNGNSIKCYHDDELMSNVTSTDLQNETQHGLYTTGTCWADNFEFTPLGTSSGSYSFTVQCEDINNSADFQTGGLPNTRVLTSGSTNLGDISEWAKDDWNTTIDIKEPFQEVLDRPGFVLGNHISAIVSPLAGCASGERFRVESFDGQANRAAKLALSW